MSEIEISFKNFPQWLFPCELFNIAISNGDTTILYDFSIEIPNNDTINNIEDFDKIVECCDYFRYNNQGMKYPLLVFAFYFINEKSMNKLDFEEYREISLRYYIRQKNIEENSEEWNSIIFPALNKIAFKYLRNFGLNKYTIEISQKDKIIGTFCYFKTSFPKCVLYHIFYEELERIFNHKAYMKFFNSNYLSDLYSKNTDQNIGFFLSILKSIELIHEFRENIIIDNIPIEKISNYRRLIVKFISKNEEIENYEEIFCAFHNVVIFLNKDLKSITNFIKEFSDDLKDNNKIVSNYLNCKIRIR